MQNSSFSVSKSAGDPAICMDRAQEHPLPHLSWAALSLVFFSTAWTRSTLFASIRLLMSLMLLWREERRHRPGYQPQTAEQSSIHSPLECSTVQKHQMWETLQEEAWSLKGVLGCFKSWARMCPGPAVEAPRAKGNYKKEQVYSKFSLLHLPSFQSILQYLCMYHVLWCHSYFGVYLYFWISQHFAMWETILNLYTMWHRHLRHSLDVPPFFPMRNSDQSLPLSRPFMIYTFLSHSLKHLFS